MIVRVSHDKENPYIVINKHCSNNKTLSFKALGIHTYLMSKPDDWRANEAELAKAHNEGLSAIRSGVQELIEHGYISRTRAIDPKTKRVVGWEWTVYETPSANPNYVPHAENQNVEPDCENRILDTQDKKPDCDFPLLENPRVENRTLISNELLSNKNTKSAEAVAVQPKVEPEEQTPPLPVQADVLPLSKQYDALLEELRNTKNRQAVLYRIYVMCFGKDETTPDYGYLGKVANQVGGAGYLAQRFWDLSRDRPDGDILAYILKAHKNKSNGNGYNGYKQVQPGINTQKAGELER